MYLMASTISRVCGWISRNIFQGKEKKQSEHCRNSIATNKLANQNPISSYFRKSTWSSEFLLVKFFVDLICSITLSDLHGGIFGPRCFFYQQILTPVKLRKSGQQKKCFGVQGPRRLFLRRGKICGVWCGSSCPGIQILEVSYAIPMVPFLLWFYMFQLWRGIMLIFEVQSWTEIALIIKHCSGVLDHAGCFFFTFQSRVESKTKHGQSNKTLSVAL